ncbi:unnamed protein product [Effrenium voratum]|nr:unnamed protein product [Effrenium voratum]
MEVSSEPLAKLEDEVPEWLAHRVRVLCKPSCPSPTRLELIFGNFDLSPTHWDLLLTWLAAPNGLAQQAAAGARGPLPVWADFRNAKVGDSELEALVRCLTKSPGPGTLGLERLWLADNEITNKSVAALRNLHLGNLRDLDLAGNILDDASSFSLISSLAEANSVCTVFLAGNLIRNPPALVERLHKAGIKVHLDEVPGDSPRMSLPQFCFQRAVKSDLPRPAKRKGRTTPVKMESESPDADSEVSAAIRSMKAMLVEAFAQSSVAAVPREEDTPLLPSQPTLSMPSQLVGFTSGPGIVSTPGFVNSVPGNGSTPGFVNGTSPFLPGHVNIGALSNGTASFLPSQAHLGYVHGPGSNGTTLWGPPFSQHPAPPPAPQLFPAPHLAPPPPAPQPPAPAQPPPRVVPAPRVVLAPQAAPESPAAPAAPAELAKYEAALLGDDFPEVGEAPWKSLRRRPRRA